MMGIVNLSKRVFAVALIAILAISAIAVFSPEWALATAAAEGTTSYYSGSDAAQSLLVGETEDEAWVLYGPAYAEFVKQITRDRAETETETGTIKFFKTGTVPLSGIDDEQKAGEAPGDEEENDSKRIFETDGKTNVVEKPDGETEDVSKRLFGTNDVANAVEVFDDEAGTGAESASGTVDAEASGPDDADRDSKNTIELRANLAEADLKVRVLDLPDAVTEDEKIHISIGVWNLNADGEKEYLCGKPLVKPDEDQIFDQKETDRIKACEEISIEVKIVRNQKSQTALDVHVVNDEKGKPLSRLNLCAAAFNGSVTGSFERGKIVKGKTLYVKASKGLLVDEEIFAGVYNKSKVIDGYTYEIQTDDRQVEFTAAWGAQSDKFEDAPRLFSIEVQFPVPGLFFIYALQKNLIDTGITSVIVDGAEKEVKADGKAGPILYAALKELEQRQKQEEQEQAEELKKKAEEFCEKWLSIALASPSVSEITVRLNGASVDSIDGEIDLREQTFAVMATSRAISTSEVSDIQDRLARKAEECLNGLRVEVWENNKKIPVELAEAIRPVENADVAGMQDPNAERFVTYSAERTFQLDIKPDSKYTIDVFDDGDGGKSIGLFTLVSRSFGDIEFDANKETLNAEDIINGYTVSGSAEPEQKLRIVCSCWHGDESPLETPAVIETVSKDGRWECALDPDMLGELLGHGDGHITVRADYATEASNEAIPTDRDGVAWEFRVDAEPPEIRIGVAEAFRDQVILAENTFKALDGSEFEVVIARATGDLVTFRALEGVEIDGISVESETPDQVVYKIALRDKTGRFEITAQDEAENRAEPQVYTVRAIQTPTFEDGLDVVGPINVKAISGTFEAGETLIGGYWFDGDADNNDIFALDVEATADGRWTAVLPEGCCYGHDKLGIRLEYEGMGEIAHNGKTWPLDFEAPEIPAESITAEIDGMPRETKLLQAGEDGIKLFFVPGLNARLILRAEPSEIDEQISYYWSTRDRELEDGKYDGMLRAGDEGDVFEIRATDALGNMSAVQVEACEAEKIEAKIKTPNALLSWRNALELEGTAQPGWQLVVVLRVNDISRARLELPYAVQEDGTWSASVSPEEIYQRLAEANASQAADLALVVDYANAGGADSAYAATQAATAPLKFDFDRDVKFEINPVYEGEINVSGRTVPGSYMYAEDSDGNMCMSDEVEEGGEFTIALKNRAKLKDSLTIYPIIGDIYLFQQAQTVEVEPNDAEIVIDKVETTGNRLTVTGQAKAGFDVTLSVQDSEGNEVALSAYDEQKNGAVSASEGEFRLEASGLADGVYTVTVSYANISKSASRSAVIDTIPPEIAVEGEIYDTSDVLTGNVGEEATVTATLYDAEGNRIDWEQEAQSGSDGGFSIGLPDDLHKAGYLLVDAKDKADNRARQQRIEVVASPLLIGAILPPEPDGKLDGGKSYDLTGWVVAVDAQERPDIQLHVSSYSTGDEQLGLRWSEDEKKLEELRLEGDVAQFVRIGDARCWSFSLAEKIDLWKVQYKTGALNVRLTDSDGAAIGSPEWQEGGSAELNLELVQKAQTRVLLIVITLALAAGLCVALLLVIRITRILRKLQDAVIDEGSGDSKLTIRKRV